MKISAKSTINELLKTYPFLLDFLVSYNDKFSLLKNRAFRATMGRMASLKKVAAIGEIPLPQLMQDISRVVFEKTGSKIEVEIEDEAQRRRRLDELKKIVADLHRGLDPESAKARFSELIREVDAMEVAEMEEMLIKEGLPVQEVHRLCDTHLAVIRDGLEEEPLPPLPPGHPIHTYQAENELITAAAQAFQAALNQDIELGRQSAETASKLESLARIETHYLRKENQLFPFLEKHEVTGPPKVMWAVHDDVRALIKESGQALKSGNLDLLAQSGAELVHTVIEMVFKENRILFPMAFGLLSEEEWHEIRRGEDSIGYLLDEAPPAWAPAAPEKHSGPDLVALQTGALSAEQISMMLKVLPLDMSFVDADDRVLYYTDSDHRVFPRSPGVIGRKVQNCHPPKSLHQVQTILDQFRAGIKDQAEFWIDYRERFVHIRYFAVRDAEGRYRGTVELVQDVTDIRGLEGERRLLDWK